MKDLELGFCDKNITPFGGMVLMKKMMDHLGFPSLLKSLTLPQPRSNRGYDPTQLMIQFMMSVWCGANAYEQCEVTRFDDVLRRIFNFKKMAGHRAISRFFGKFNQRTCNEVFDEAYRWFFSSLHINYVTLDLDSTVMTRYGKQDGATKGYNPKKKGRSSHHPLMAFVADTEMVANFWLRPGSTHSANNAEAFLENTLHKLGNVKCSLVRADSGFSGNSFLQNLESKKQNYIIALPMMQPLQRAMASNKGWWPLVEVGGEGIEICCFEHQPDSWNKSRRVIAVRQQIKVRELANKSALGKQLSFFGKDDEEYGKYRYGAFVTSLDLPALEIWRLYRGRANCENRIKELKYDFAADKFNQRNFFATEATLSTVMLSYNLMNFFRKALLKSHGSQTLKTLRYKLFSTAGYVVKDGKKRILTLAASMQKRGWITNLWEESTNFQKPIRFNSIFEPS
jgi:hypothetical protein